MIHETSSFSESLLELRQLVLLDGVHQTWIPWHGHAKLLNRGLSVESSSVYLIIPVHAQNFVHDFGLLKETNLINMKGNYLRMKGRYA